VTGGGGGTASVSGCPYDSPDFLVAVSRGHARYRTPTVHTLDKDCWRC
jgi:hypothetical protein